MDTWSIAAFFLVAHIMKILHNLLRKDLIIAKMLQTPKNTTPYNLKINIDFLFLSEYKYPENGRIQKRLTYIYL